MNQEKRKQFEKIIKDSLIALMEEKDDLEDLKAEKSADDLDMAVQILSQTMKTNLLRRKSLYIFKLKNALDRIEDGTYGECDSCGENITTKRLLARPTATFCIFCKEIQEKDERQRRAIGGILSFEPDALSK